MLEKNQKTIPKRTLASIYNLIFAASCIPAASQAAENSLNQSLDSWQRASLNDKTLWIEKVTNKLQTSANISGQISVPFDAVIQCVNHDRSPSQAKIQERTVTITVGMAIMVCLKTEVPELRTGKYQANN